MQSVEHLQRRRGASEIVADAAVKLPALRAAGALVEHAGGAGWDGLSGTNRRGAGIRRSLLVRCDLGDDAGDLVDRAITLGHEESRVRTVHVIAEHTAAEVGVDGEAGS